MEVKIKHKDGIKKIDEFLLDCPEISQDEREEIMEILSYESIVKLSKGDPYITYRKEENLYELYDPDTNKSYWLDVDLINKEIVIKLERVTSY